MKYENWWKGSEICKVGGQWKCSGVGSQTSLSVVTPISRLTSSDTTLSGSSSGLYYTADLIWAKISQNIHLTEFICSANKHRNQLPWTEYKMKSLTVAIGLKQHTAWKWKSNSLKYKLSTNWCNSDKVKKKKKTVTLDACIHHCFPCNYMLISELTHLHIPPLHKSLFKCGNNRCCAPCSLSKHGMKWGDDDSICCSA